MLLREKPWDRDLQLLLASIIAFNLVPHIALVPIWITALSCTCIAWKALYLTKGLRLPRRSVLTVAAAVAFGGVFFSYGTIFGQEAAGGLLVVMASLKLLETNRYRDAMLVIFTSYFLLMAYLLDTQSLAATIYMVVDIGLITALMSQVHRREKRGPGSRSIWPSLRLLGITVPLWVFIFVFFPRFSTGLWNLKPPSTGTGFSDDLNPGAVASLVGNDEPAFRVTFDSRADLSPENAYWRGSVLTIGDGLKWSKSHTHLSPDAYIPAPNERIRVYTIWLEAGFQKWLFALDVPFAIASGDTQVLQDVHRLPGFTYEFVRPRYARSSYSARSATTSPIQTMTPADFASLVKLPPKLDEKIVALAAELKGNADRDPFPGKFIDARYAKEILDWLGAKGFRYSKTPGFLRSNDGAEQLSEFLFESKVGFCEHYAGAFATLMRAMGVPARVVVGFQGARPNELGGYWIVSKMDAHAWTEVWREEADPGDAAADAQKAATKHGTKSAATPVAHTKRDPVARKFGRWVRIDPTEAVAPLRLQLGGDYNRLDGSVAAGLSGDELRRRLQGGLSGTFRRLELISDFVQMKWNSFLLAYDFDYQLQLLANLGVNRLAGYLLVGILIVGAVLIGAIMIVFQRRRAKKEDPLVREWRKFCGQFARLGLERGANEGPLDFARRAAARFPSSAADILRIAETYALLRYGNDGERKARRLEFRQVARGFSIKDSSRSSVS